METDEADSVLDDDAEKCCFSLSPHANTNQPACSFAMQAKTHKASGAHTPHLVEAWFLSKAVLKAGCMFPGKVFFGGLVGWRAGVGGWGVGGLGVWGEGLGLWVG